jgi:1,2-dihydroxy-3-keto-5-methylthiopentene dioxygenase
MVRAWYMKFRDSDELEDQRLPHMGPSVPVDRVACLGVQYWTVNAEEFETDAQFKQLRKQEGFSYMDIIEISPDKLSGYEEKIKMFYKEHLHDDDEIRLVISGSGYFDVRDETDRWIRIECTPGDMISLPAGIYHRFTLDSKVSNWLSYNAYCGTKLPF